MTVKSNLFSTPSSKTCSMTVLMQNIAEHEKLQFSLLHEGTIICLKNQEGLSIFIKRYVLPINYASHAQICRDKAATSDLLKKAQIPHIRHRLFLNPKLNDWIPINGSWPAIHEYGKKHGFQLVCKLKGGSRGEKIERVKNGRELEQAVSNIFLTSRDVVLCAYRENIQNEFRVIVYKGKAELILKKQLPTITGNGTDTKAQLISKFLSSLHQEHKEQLVKLIPPDVLVSTEIPKDGETIQLHWKHNGPGAMTYILGGESYSSLENKTRDFPIEILDIALKTASTIGICFASVDIVEIPNDPKNKIFRVLEVNSATMIDHEMDHEPELSRKIELRIYTKIVHDLFDLNIQASHQSTLPNHQGLPLDQLSSQKIFPISSLLKQIAQENGWEIQTYSQGWFSKLSFGNIDRFVYGYMFPLNSSTSQKICSDKAATSTVLKEHKIPQIYHHSVALGENFSVWEKCVEVFEKYGKNVVCKPVDGSGGVNVEHVTSRLQLESVVTNLFKNYHEIAICGFEVIKREYRLIMLEGTAEIIFKKTPPYMVGDGVHSTQALVQQFLRAMEPKKRLNLIHNIDAKILLSHEVPNKGEKIFLHWKHNLGQGATCLIIGGQSFFEIGGKTESNKYESITKSMIELAKKTVSALNVRFASVDIVKVIESDGNKKLKIMEVNSGIMMDNLMEQYSSMGIILAKRVYSKALHISFNEADQKLA